MLVHPHLLLSQRERDLKSALMKFLVGVALGGAVNASSSKQTATGYEKSEMQGGNMVSERWDNQSRSGSYSVMVASRFAVEAEGSAPSIDVLKGAVGAVNLGQVQALAK